MSRGKTLRDILDTQSIVAQERLGISEEEMEEKILIEIADGEYIEVEDIFLLPKNGGMVFRMKQK